MKRILVTGANGQLGKELRDIAVQFSAYEFLFLSREDMPIHHFELVRNTFAAFKPDYCINCAAYTAVDKAESEKELAHTINAEAVAALAGIAKKRNIPFISFSTDYVFNGNAERPYLTDTKIEPVNYYGQTKADGEQMAIAANDKTIIIRTSWVFSSHGNNFVKTMMRLMKDKDALNIVGDQRGRPTYAKDLALATIQILIALNAGTVIKGIYHYANAGETTWFKFAEKIKELAGLECNLTAITSDQFPTPAKRPSYSVLDTHKIEKDLGLHIPQWEMALKQCIHQLTHS